MATGIHSTHQLYRAEVQGDLTSLFFCMTCGAYAQARLEALAKMCPGKPKHSAFHKRLGLGMQPGKKVRMQEI